LDASILGQTGGIFYGPAMATLKIQRRAGNRDEVEIKTTFQLGSYRETHTTLLGS
jgi:hypothetical protein